MKDLLRRFRGALGNALTWAAGWSIAGAAIGLLNVLVAGAPLSVVIFPFAYSWAKMGFLGGTLFSIVLGIAEGRTRLDQMSIPRIAAWGGIGALLFATPIAIGLGLTTEMLVGLPFVVLLGAGSAAGSLVIARAAQDRELLEQEDARLGLPEAT